MNARSTSTPLVFVILLLTVLTSAGCDMLDMYDEPRYEPLEASPLFDDGTSARPLIPGTVARGELRSDEVFYTGKREGKFVEELPLELTPDHLARGQERFNIYCSPCHGRLGDGRGMIVERGFRQPPSFIHTDRLLQEPVGHFYDVISNGFGAMPSYASRVTPEDRWKIVAYIRALQLSQNATLDDVPEELRDEIQPAGPIEQAVSEKRRAAQERDRREREKNRREVEKIQRSPEEGERRRRELQEEQDGEQSTDSNAGNEEQSAGGRAASSPSPSPPAPLPGVPGRGETERRRSKPILVSLLPRYSGGEGSGMRGRAELAGVPCVKACLADGPISYWLCSTTSGARPAEAARNVFGTNARVVFAPKSVVLSRLVPPYKAATRQASNDKALGKPALSEAVAFALMRSAA